jgi:hypothetical protein
MSKKLVLLVMIGCGPATQQHTATQAVLETKLSDWDLAVSVPFQTESEEGDLLLGTNVDRPETPGWSLRIDLGRDCMGSATDAEQCAAEECRHDGKCGVAQPTDATLFQLAARAHVTTTTPPTTATKELFAVDGACKIRLAVRAADKDQLDAAVAKVVAGLHTISGGAPKIAACHPH